MSRPLIYQEKRRVGSASHKLGVRKILFFFVI